jgi:hypothetical protein
MFCARDESIDHLFFSLALLRDFFGALPSAYNTPAHPENG